MRPTLYSLWNRCENNRIQLTVLPQDLRLCSFDSRIMISFIAYHVHLSVNKCVLFGILKSYSYFTSRQIASFIVKFPLFCIIYILSSSLSVTIFCIYLFCHHMLESITSFVSYESKPAEILATRNRYDSGNSPFESHSFYHVA